MTSSQPLDPATIAALILDTRPWLSCDECFETLDTYAETVARDSGSVDPRMDTHLSGCDACREEADGLITLLSDDESGAGGG